MIRTTLKLLAIVFSFALSAVAAPEITVGPDDWPWWRGPTRNGKAAKGQKPSVAFGSTENVIWKSPVPGRGHCSPVLIGNRVFLSTADEVRKTHSVLAYDRKTGDLLWKKEVDVGAFPERIHKKNTHASPTVASDGQRVFATFYSGNAVQVVALNLDGTLAWKKAVGPFHPKKYEFGYGASPVLYNDWIIVVGDQVKGGFLAALDRLTGELSWRIKRPGDINYATPIVGKVAGKDQILISGAGQVSSYDPSNGKLNWAAKETCPQTAGTPVWDGDLVFTSGGYPMKQTIAVRAGTGEKVWENQRKSYEQSMMAHNGYLYAVDDGGIAYCWRSQDGEEQWRERLAGPVSASPILVGDRLYAANENGQFFVFKADPKKWELLASNKLGDEAFATPAFCGNRIYARVAHHEADGRKEYLYCIGAESK
jgi:outer membrane protein assembly factor BamB